MDVKIGPIALTFVHKNAHRRFTVWQDVPLLPRMDASQTATRVLAKEHSTNLVLKCSWTHDGLSRRKSGDRYPLGPPNFNAGVTQW